MDLPSFLWLWRIAAWSMGLTLSAYLLLAATGGSLAWSQKTTQAKPQWLRLTHRLLGISMVGLIWLLWSIGIVGTLGEYGQLGHSAHLPAGLGVVLLATASAWAASQIDPLRPWARKWHIGLNLGLGMLLLVTLFTGWQVVQKYLP